MANWASTAYVIEGPQESLERIRKAINDAIESKDGHYEEYKACINLGYASVGLETCSLGGNIIDEPDLCDGVLRFWAEERWGLQDFHKLLKKLFPDIKVYWGVEESDCGVYCTNDKEGKYFPDRYWVDTCIDGNYQSEYFTTEEGVYKWLSDITNGVIKTEKDVTKFNEDIENEDDFISIHEFAIEDED